MSQERVQIDKKAQSKKAAQSKRSVPVPLDTRTPSGRPLPY